PWAHHPPARRPPMDANCMIETRSLRRTFKARQGPVEAVAGIDLRVEKGAIFGFLGPNGAGKTTTLRMLSTLQPPSGGDATVAGCDLLRGPQRVRERIGYVGQQGGTDYTVRGRTELVFQGRLYGMTAGDARRRAAELITLLEIHACADRPSGASAGGSGRGVASAVVGGPGPRLVFLEEPPGASTRMAARGSGTRSGACARVA